MESRRFLFREIWPRAMVAFIEATESSALHLIVRTVDSHRLQFGRLF
jgi:hypothetical protein